METNEKNTAEEVKEFFEVIGIRFKNAGKIYGLRYETE